MGRYGFDLDGTLDSCPECAHLARALALAGHKIWIITGSEFSKKAIAAKLYGLNVVDYQKIYQVDGELGDIAVGKAKGELCNKLKLDLYFDNDPEVLKGIASVSDVSRVYILNGNIMQPEVTPTPKRTMCRCQLQVRGEFVPRRCMHCTEFLETPERRSFHSRWHHAEGLDGSLRI